MNTTHMNEYYMVRQYLLPGTPFLEQHTLRMLWQLTNHDAVLIQAMIANDPEFDFSGKAGLHRFLDHTKIDRAAWDFVCYVRSYLNDKVNLISSIHYDDTVDTLRIGIKE